MQVLSARRLRRVVRGLGRAFLYLSIYLSILAPSASNVARPMSYMKFRVAATRLRVGTLGIYWDSRALTEYAIPLCRSRASESSSVPPLASTNRSVAALHFTGAREQLQQFPGRVGLVVVHPGHEITGREICVRFAQCFSSTGRANTHSAAFPTPPQNDNC